MSNLLKLRGHHDSAGGYTATQILTWDVKTHFCNHGAFNCINTGPKLMVWHQTDKSPVLEKSFFSPYLAHTFPGLSLTHWCWPLGALPCRHTTKRPSAHCFQVKHTHSASPAFCSWRQAGGTLSGCASQRLFWEFRVDVWAVSLVVHVWCLPLCVCVWSMSVCVCVSHCLCNWLNLF